MPIDPNIPLAVRPPQMSSPLDIYMQVERLKQVQQNRADQQQLQQERQLEIEQRQRLAEGSKLLSDSYKQYSTTDPMTGEPSTDYDKITSALMTGGYPELAETVTTRGLGIKKARQDLFTSQLTHDKMMNAWKMAVFSGVQSPEDYAHARAAMHGVPGIDLKTLPEEYDADWVKSTVDTLQKRADRYEQAMDPAGYQKKGLDAKKTQAEIDKLTAETQSLTGKQNQNPEDYYRIIDDAIAATKNPQGYEGSVAMAKGRIRQAFATGDYKEANKAVEDLMQELRSVNVARNTAPIRFEYGPYGGAAANQMPNAAAWTFNADPPQAGQSNIPRKEYGGMTDEAIYQAAVTNALTGAFPPGQTRNPQIVARNNAIQNKAAALVAAAGTDPATLRAEYAAKKGALGKLMTQFNTTEAAETTANLNLDMALSRSPKVSRTDSRWINSHMQQFQRDFTEAGDLTDFEVAIYTAAREYAKVASGGAGSVAGLTDSASKEAEKLLSAAQSPVALQRAVATMKQDMANFREGWGSQIRKQSGTLADFVHAGRGSSGTEPKSKSGALPDLSGLRPKGLRVFGSGAFKGIWKMGPDGKPVKVSDDPDDPRYMKK